MENPFSEILDRLSHIESILVKIQKQAPEKEEADDLLSVEQVAKMLKVSVPSVYRLTMTRKIPFKKVHKRLFFSKKELHDFINAGSKPVRV